MSLRLQASAITLAFIGGLTCAIAQVTRDTKPAVATDKPRPALTGKERLGRKWTDEQRIDNCHVPLDKRGTRKRPSACSNDPSS